MEYKTFSELTLKDLTVKNLMIIIRFILVSILFILIYCVIWHFIYKIGNEYVNFFGPIICLIIGWKRLGYYEEAMTYKIINDYERIRYSYKFEINPFLKIILTPIVIPLMISAYVCEFITDCIYKDNAPKSENTKNTNVNANTKIKTAEEIEKNWKEYERKYKLNDNNFTTYDYSDLEEEYYCEICLKRITEEDYELYDCMCEDCFFEKEDYKNMKN